MSYLFNAANERMTGTLTSTYAATCTLALYLKTANHPAAASCIMQLGASSSAVADSLALRTTATDNQWGARYTDPAASADTASRTQNVDTTWAPLVATFPSASSRIIRVADYANSGSASAARTASDDVMKYLRIGETLAAAEDLGAAGTFYIAEVAIWNAILSQTDIESYMAGTAASSIAAANLIGYWPLNASNATQSNLGVDAGGDLSVTGATYDADHPTITTSGPIAAFARGSNIILKGY